MYPRGSAIAYSASNRVDDLALGIDRDFFRSLVSMRADSKLSDPKTLSTFVSPLLGDSNNSPPLFGQKMSRQVNLGVITAGLRSREMSGQ